MDHDRYPPDYIRTILSSVRTIAMVGASANPVRPSFFVLKYLIDKGYELYPVNPGLAGKEILGRAVHASLKDVPVAIDMVDVFRNSEAALAITREALALDPLPKVIWMQLSVRNDEAAALAEAQGVAVVMNRCPEDGIWQTLRRVGLGRRQSRPAVVAASDTAQFRPLPKSRDCAEILTATAARAAARCQSGGPGRSRHRGPASI